MQFYYFLFFPYIIRSPLSMSSGSYVILWLQLLIISPESPPVATNDLTLRPSSCSILSQSPSSMAAVPKTTPDCMQSIEFVPMAFFGVERLIAGS